MTDHSAGPWIMKRSKNGQKMKFSAPQSEHQWEDFAEVIVRMDDESEDNLEGVANAELMRSAPELLQEIGTLNQILETQKKANQFLDSRERQLQQELNLESRRIKVLQEQKAQLEKEITGLSATVGQLNEQLDSYEDFSKDVDSKVMVINEILHDDGKDRDLEDLTITLVSMASAAFRAHNPY